MKVCVRDAKNYLANTSPCATGYSPAFINVAKDKHRREYSLSAKSIRPVYNPGNNGFIC